MRGKQTVNEPTVARINEDKILCRPIRALSTIGKKSPRRSGSRGSKINAKDIDARTDAMLNINISKMETQKAWTGFNPKLMRVAVDASLEFK